MSLIHLFHFKFFFLSAIDRLNRWKGFFSSSDSFIYTTVFDTQIVSNQIGWVRTQDARQIMKKNPTTKLIDKIGSSRAGSFFLYVHQIPEKKGYLTHTENSERVRERENRLRKSEWTKKNSIWLIWIWIRLSPNKMKQPTKKNWTCFL